MAIYELTYQRLAERKPRQESPAVAIALSDLRMLKKRRLLRLALIPLALFTLALVGYVVIRNGIIDQILPDLAAGFAKKLPPIDAPFFETAFRSSFYQFLLVLLALFGGSGRIAEDLRANALAIYLSKPLTRADYLLGKVGATACVIGLGALAAPLLVFLVACLATPGFLTDHLRIGIILLILGLVTTAYHTAAVLFFSSMVKSGRLAGLLYMGLYFITGKVELVVRLVLSTGAGAFLGYTRNVDTLALHLFGDAGAKDPALLPALLVLVLVIVFGLGAAWRRVQAVEVVS